jgi:predicted glycoside hydrolase/deacetylase ChbG (UPF0249 family)
LSYFDKASTLAFTNELNAQVDKAIEAKIPITHLDSHYHLHTLPCFYRIFLDAAKRYNLKLRLAQTYNEGSLLKFAYRKYVNHALKINHVEYAERFETVARYLTNTNNMRRVEVMLHPDMGPDGKLTDHYHADTMTAWIQFLGNR